MKKDGHNDTATDTERLREAMKDKKCLVDDNATPLYHPAGILCMLRSDSVVPGLTHEEAFRNAPEAHGYFTSVKVITKTSNTNI